jgi:polysaccharide biosynthesis transport protein
MRASQITQILRARWGLVAAVAAATVAAVAAVSLVLPKEYTGTSALLVDSKSPDPINGMVVGGGMPGYIATQIDIIKSERVARRVVQTLKLTESPVLKEQWSKATNGYGDYEAWTAKLMLQNLSVKPSRESSVIEVAYTGADPQFSAVVANAFAQAYIDTTLDLRVEMAKRYSQRFDSQAQEAKKRLETVQTRLSDLQKEAGIVATDERFDVENARLGELNTQFTLLQALLAESESRTRAAGPNISEVLNNPLVSGMKSEMIRQEARMKEIGSKLGTAHPQYLELQESTAELRRKLEQETSRITSSLGLNNAVNASRLAQVKRELDLQKKKVLALRDQRDSVSVLVKEVENAQRAYDAIALRFSETNLESQSAQTNVSVLKVATPALDTATPRVGLNIILGAVFGLLLGTSAAFLRELTDRKVRTEADLQEGMGLISLGTMPTSTEAEKTRRPLMLGRSNSDALMQARRLPELAAPQKA